MFAEQLKRWVATGLGVALLTKEKAEAVIADLIRQGELSREEGKELLDSLIQRAQAEKDELQRRVDAEVRRVLQSAGVARQEDVRRLEERVERLERQLSRLLEAAGGSPGPGSPTAEG